ncbi:TPA: transferrin-binding protein-like solute binding protein [Haemophilus influenzae]
MKSVPLITGGLSFLLSACSGGGSFDVDNVSNPSSSKPRYQDDTSNSRKKSDLKNLSIPSLGGGMKLVAQNIHPSSSKEPSFLNENDYISYFSSLSTIKEDVENVKNNNNNGGATIGSIKEPDATNPTQNDHGQKYVYSGLYYIQSWRLTEPSKNKYYAGYYGYAYYFGKQTATTLPVNGEATYKGTWDFITATKNGQKYPLLSNYDHQAYSRRSATREDIDLDRETGLTSEFTVDFGKKKLTGGLYYNLRKTNANTSQNTTHKLYDLEADVHSNRFRGKVTPTESTSNQHPFTSEGTLEGGFYGPNAEELGGKFLAKDKRVFGVFSAKETEETKTKALSKETLIDGKLTTFSTKKPNATTDATTNTAANAENFTTKDIPSFGEADYLLIDNYPVPLFPEENTDDFATSKHHNIGKKHYKVEACCKNLSYVKFGIYSEDPLNGENGKEKEKQATKSIDTYYQFLLGHRTPNADIPKKGSAQYRGSWFGYISDGKTSYSPTGNKQQDKNAVAEFTVDFGNKTLKGQLKHADTQNPVFNIEADFKNSGNAFKGTATATNFVIDGNNSQNGNTQINIKTEVNGAFYGPNATELGGYFTYNGKDTTPKNSENSQTVPSSPNSENARAAVVFGAKKQVETNNK